MRRYGLATMFLPLLFSGCASTTFKPNPGDHDKGLRYYRPKPYLFIAQAKNDPDKYVDITLQYLPDFSEEYSIHIRPGIGKNQTKVTLNEGWNLVSVDANIDSEVPENIKAASDLVSSIGGLVKPTVGSLPPQNVTIRAAASNVPLGYYESVISRGPDGKKHLYGWRYVGFGPMNSCPVESGGMACTDCRSTDLFALVMVHGVMSFVPMGEVSRTPILEAVTASPPASAPAGPSGTTLSGIPKGILSKTNEVLKSARLMTTELKDEPDVVIGSNSVKVTIKLPAEVLAATPQSIKTRIENEAKGVVAAADATLGPKTTVTFAPSA